MDLFGKLGTAEQHGREAAWQGLTPARTSLEEAQSRLRRKMRLRPRPARPQLPVFVSVHERENPVEPTAAIVTIHGEDVPPEQTETPENQVA